VNEYENFKTTQKRLFELENLYFLVIDLLSSETSKELNKNLLALSDKIHEIEKIPNPNITTWS
jgi:hypothetical protein